MMDDSCWMTMTERPKYKPKPSVKLNVINADVTEAQYK